MNRIRVSRPWGATLSIAVLALVAVAPACRAHEYWLAPSSYKAAPGDTIAITAFVGTGFRGERKPYAAPRAIRFTLDAKKTVDLRPAATNGDLTWARFIAPDGGGAMLAYQSDFVPIELEAAEFDQYLKLEGLDEPLRARAPLGPGAGLGRERYARCPKTWIAGTDVARALKPQGLPLEVVPLSDPTTASPLRVKVLFHDRPLAGALVRAWHEPLARAAMPLDGATRDSVGPVAQARTDAGGVAVLKLEGAGEWLVSAVHMTPCAKREIADWESLWASMTFARGSRPR